VLPLCTRAIVPLIRRGSDSEVRRIFDAAYSAQTIPNYFNFRVKLRLIIQLLKVTAAAATKIRTGWLDSNRRRLDDLFDRCEVNLAFRSFNLNPQAIAWRGERHHHRSLVSMRESHAAGQYTLDSGFPDVLARKVFHRLWV